MAVPKTTSVQNDFSAGELDPSAKRGDSDKTLRAGLRQCSNMRIRNTRKLDNRFGRSIKFIDGPRIDEVVMSPGNVFELCFSAGKLTVRNPAGASVFTTTLLGDGATAIPWTANTVSEIVWDTYQLAIYLCFPGIIPQVLSWDGVSTWALASFAELMVGNQKRTPFYRMAAKGIAIAPITASGSGVTVDSSAGYFTAGMVGTRIRFIGRQMLITGVTNGNQATVTIEEPVPGSQSLDFGVTDPTTIFSVGDVVQGSESGAQGVVFDFPGSNEMRVQLLTLGTTTINSPYGTLTQAFTETDIIIGAAGSSPISGAAGIGGPLQSTFWDEEVMNAYRGYPQSVAVDQSRLIFSNFPALPNGIGWSALGVPTDLYANDASSPDNAIFELAPNKTRVLYVMGGAESSEFVFTDSAVFYISITPTNPLKPGSVGFNLLSGEGCAAVQPRLAQELIVYIAAGGSSVRAITATGAYLRPFEVRHISDEHDHLFASPVAIAAPGATDPNFTEQYFYVLNGNGTLAVAKIIVQSGQIVGEPGWVPWSGVGTIDWISSRRGSQNLWLGTTYPTGPVTVAELLDATQYLDAGLFVNSIPAALTPPGGKGPLWWYAGGSVSLIDQATRSMGTYQIDANGFIIPQNNGGENLAAATLVAGQPWTAMVEPFVPGVQEGPEGQGGPQRMRKRRIARNVVYVQNSTGFVMQSLRNGVPQAQRRISTWNQDEDPTKPPKLRELAYEFRFKGRDHDPRQVIIKDTPGPLTILENSLEVTF